MEKQRDIHKTTHKKSLIFPLNQDTVTKVSQFPYGKFEKKYLQMTINSVRTRIVSFKKHTAKKKYMR